MGSDYKSQYITLITSRTWILRIYDYIGKHNVGAVSHIEIQYNDILCKKQAIL